MTDYALMVVIVTRFLNFAPFILLELVKLDTLYVCGD